MSIQELHKRYLWLAKSSLQFLKDMGFEKKGSKYSKQKNNLTLNIYPQVPRSWLNSEKRYEFDIIWDIESQDEDLINLYKFIGGNKKLTEVWLIVNSISLQQYKGLLTDQDPPEFDQKYAEAIKEEIQTIILPLFDRVYSIDDIIQLVEEEEKLEKQHRKFFPYGLYRDLAFLYTYKGCEEKALKMCDRDIEETPIPARKLAEKRKEKFIKYFGGR